MSKSRDLEIMEVLKNEVRVQEAIVEQKKERSEIFDDNLEIMREYTTELVRLNGMRHIYIIFLSEITK